MCAACIHPEKLPGIEGQAVHIDPHPLSLALLPSETHPRWVLHARRLLTSSCLPHTGLDGRRVVYGGESTISSNTSSSGAPNGGHRNAQGSAGLYMVTPWCNAGSFAPEYNIYPCRLCPNGSYSDLAGGCQCSGCAGASYTKFPGATSSEMWVTLTGRMWLLQHDRCPPLLHPQPHPPLCRWIMLALSSIEPPISEAGPVSTLTMPLARPCCAPVLV